MLVPGATTPLQPYRPSGDASVARDLAARAIIASGALAELSGKLASYIRLQTIAGTNSAEIDIITTELISQIIFRAGKFLFDGGALMVDTIIANKFLTNQGVDLAAIVPGQFNYELAGSDVPNGRTVSDGSSLGPIAGSANGLLNGHRIQIGVLGAIAGGSSVNPFSVYIDLYYNNGGGWIFGANVGLVQSAGSYTDFISGGTVTAGNWGNCQLALYLRGGGGGTGAVYNVHWDADITWRK
jgi:hypothetical protein